ncbi:MAG: Ig-like domain-containing protein, partial [Saprospiraceae bacterium]
DENEVLRPNTTYTINFGSAVQDLHEGNPAKDLRFVFSTGDYLDSLSVGGAVADAYTGDPVENVSVMLYEHLDDSVARNEKPYYFAKTDKNGQFSIANVKAGNFKMLAFEDKDQNLKWAADNEGIAFVDTVRNVSPATARQFNSMRFFRDQARFRLFDKSANRYGLVKLVYTGPPDSIRLRTEEEVPGLRLLSVISQDTLLVWYDLPEPTGWRLLAGSDTVTVRDLSRVDFLKTYRLGLVLETTGAPNTGRRGNQLPAPTAAVKVPTIKNVNQNPDKGAFLDFITPISALDTTKWRLQVDSNVAPLVIRPDSADARRVRIMVPWQAGKTYQLVVLPGGVTDFYGVRNLDTIRENRTVLSEKQLGGLNLTINNLVPKTNYVLQLLNGKEVVETRRFQVDLTEKRLLFTNLLTAVYTIQLIEDHNGNGLWDTGDYYAHRQPERIFTKKLDALRANWVVEATMDASANTNSQKREQSKKN